MWEVGLCQPFPFYRAGIRHEAPSYEGKGETRWDLAITPHVRRFLGMGASYRGNREVVNLRESETPAAFFAIASINFNFKFRALFFSNPLLLYPPLSSGRSEGGLTK
jgi:hypothetical protein